LSDIFVECADGPFVERKLKNSDTALVRSTVEADKEYLNFDAFLARWAILLTTSVEETLRCLMYLGYGSEDIPTAIKATRPKRRDRITKTVSRDIIQIGTFGSEGAMKTDVVRGLVKL